MILLQNIQDLIEDEYSSIQGISFKLYIKYNDVYWFENNINKTTSTSLLNGFPIEKKSYDFANARTISEATNIQNSERFIKNKNNTNSF